MKIDFEDGSYVDFQLSKTPGHVILTISAKDGSNNRKNISNSVEISFEELESLVKSVKLP